MISLHEKIRLSAVSRLVWPISLGFLLLFFLCLLKLSTVSPLCCSDDAYIASVSKNLATGQGYRSIINIWSSRKDYFGLLFDPGISTGAPSILPVALGIYLFGANAAVPGQVHVFLYLALTLILMYRMKAMTDKKTAGGILTIFLLLILSTGAYHFEQWYAQLGEVLSILLIMLSASILSSSSRQYDMHFLAGLLMGLAILTKLMSIIYVAPACLIVFSNSLQACFLKLTHRIMPSIIFYIGICVPVVFFELWKFFSMSDFKEWIENWKLFGSFMGGSVSGHKINLHFLIERWNIIHERFFIPAYALLLMLIAYPFLFFSLTTPLRRLSEILLSGVMLHLIYWVFISNGWPRYLYISIVAGIFLRSIVLVAGRVLVPRFLMACAIVMIIINGMRHLPFIYESTQKNEKHNLSAQLLASYIELSYPKERIYARSWEHISSLGYLSSMPYRYIIWNEQRNRKSQKRLFITNTQFMSEEDLLFVKFLQNSCGIEISHGIYTLYSCI